MTIVDDPPSTTGGDAERPDGSGSSSGSWFYGASMALIAGAVALLIVGVSVAAIVLLLRDNGGGAAAAPAATTELDVSLSEFAIDGELVAPAGNVSLNVVNAGAIEHNLAIRELGVATRNMSSRGVDTLTLSDLAPGEYEVICTIPGHEASGMSTTLTITEADMFEPVDMGGGHDDMSPEEMDRLMTESMLAFPAETEGLGNQILEPEVLADGTKKFTLEASVIEWEVAPGEMVEAWAYNGQVPGPRIQVDVGDNVQVELTNNTPMSTDIHWHGIHTPNDQDGVSPYTQDPIEPGDTFTYEFVAEDPAIGMYHAHFHSQVSVLNGMFAAFEIGENPIPYGETIAGVTIPEQDELDLAFDKPMVVNDAGTIGLTLNGKSFPATEPLVLDLDQWGVIHYYNEGLTAHPMHLHQFPQLVYAKDGIPLDEPYWADTINVAPGERYSVLFHADTAGVWVYHCHILTHVERAEGMFGMVTAVIVNDPEAA